MGTGFTVDISGTTGMRTGEWAEGEEFLVLPDERPQREKAWARVRLYQPDDPVVNEGRLSLRKREPARQVRPITVAEVEERAKRNGGSPHPVLVLHDEDDKPLCTLSPEQRGVAEPRAFRLLDDRNQELCRILHTPSRIGRRASWRIVFADGRPPLTGHRGTWAGWIGFVLLLPVWLLFFVGSVLVTLLSLGGVSELLVWGAPRRVVWRERWAPPLAGNALDFRYLRSGYRWNSQLLDARIAYAQATLHYFTKMHQE